MNLQPYNLNYQDGLNSYPIIDYIDEKIAGVTIGGTTDPLSSYIYLSNNSNLYIDNSNINGGIYFATSNSLNATNNNFDYSVKIDKNGKLFVYHIYSVLNPTLAAGWYDVETELANAYFNTLQTNIQFLAIEGQIASIEVDINTLKLGLVNSASALNALSYRTWFCESKIQNATANQLAIIAANRTTTQQAMDSMRNLFAYEGTMYTQVKIKVGEIANFVTNPLVVGGVGLVAGISALILGAQNDNYTSNYSNVNPGVELTETERRYLIDSNNVESLNIAVQLLADLSNANITGGFINSNIITSQFIPSLRSNKIIIGNVTTPNVAYQLEGTGDLNFNEYYRNSVSLTTLLNEKQGNLTFSQPLYNTTNTIGLNYDSSLTKVGNNLSVAPTTASKWTTSGTNIYNNNLSGNVGIGTTNPLYKLDVKGILKTDKIIIGAVTTPNVAYNLESSGDININELYRNSVSLTSTLNTKQDNLTFSQPLYNTTNTISLNYDSSLTKVGNNLSVVKTATTPIVITGNDFSLNYDSSLTKITGNLSVVKTATTPIVITGNDFSLNYDSSLTKITGNLSVVKTASLPLVITGNNWTLNYDSTLALSGNNLSVASATASKWTISGTNIYNNNTGNVGINTTNPSYKLHIEDGSVFIGDVSYTISGLGTANAYKLIFDNTYNGTAGSGNICNKIILHNHSGFNAGFGIEDSALVYQSGNRHRFYTGTTSTVYGFLGAEFYRDNFRFYGSTNTGAGGVVSNGNAGTSAYSYLSLANNSGNGILFLNSSTKTTDGGANTLTLRNDITGGDLRLSANLDSPYIYLKKSTGRVGISHINPTSRFTIKATYDDADSGLCLDSSDNGTNNQYNFKIYPYVIGGGQVGVKMRIVNNTGTTLDALTINHAGTTTFNYPVKFPVNVWNTSTDGYNRFYFGNTSRTYFSSGSGYEWRHSTDAGIAVMSVTGQLGLQNLSPIGTLSLGDSSVTNSDGSLVIHKRDSGGGTRHMKMGFYTSTFDLVIGDFGNNNTPGTWVRGFGMGYSAPDYSLYIYGTGPVYANYGYISGSDIKLKTDIKTIEKSLWKVEQLRGVEYTLILNQERNLGLIAQEVEYIVPEVVGYNDKTDTKTINYNGLIGLLIEAIKELKGEINNLNKRIEILENK